MTIEDIIEQTRQDYISDIESDYLWENATLENFYNDAESEACIRGNLIKDATTTADQSGAPLCSLTLSNGTATYATSQKILLVKKVVLSSTKLPLTPTDESWLDENYWNWRNETGAPAFFIQEKGRITFVPTPSATDTALLTVYRLPLYEKFLAPNMSIGSDAKRVAISSFRYSLAGSIYSYIADNLGETIGAVTVPGTKWAIWKASIDALQNITFTGAVNATGYDTEALAIAALPATPANSHYFGHFTVYSSAGFVAGTTALNGTGVTANFYPRRFTPEIESELHRGLINWMCHLAYTKDDTETESMPRTDRYEKKFTELFGSRPSARLLATRRRVAHQTTMRPKAFGGVPDGLGDSSWTYE